MFGKHISKDPVLNTWGKNSWQTFSRYDAQNHFLIKEKYPDF